MCMYFGNGEFTSFFRLKCGHDTIEEYEGIASKSLTSTLEKKVRTFAITFSINVLMLKVIE